jgi:hypothetical protein
MLLWHIEENRMIYCKSTHFRCVLIFSSFEEDVRQLKIVPLKNCNKRLLTFVCQSLIVVTSTQHVNFSYSLHDQCGVFLSSVFCEIFILYKTYTIYLIIGIFM